MSEKILTVTAENFEEEVLEKEILENPVQPVEDEEE